MWQTQLLGEKLFLLESAELPCSDGRDRRGVLWREPPPLLSPPPACPSGDSSAQLHFPQHPDGPLTHIDACD